MNNDYKIRLGIDLDINDLSRQIDKASGKAPKINLKADTDLIKKQIANIKFNKINLEFNQNTISHEIARLRDRIQKEIKIDLGSGIKGDAKGALPISTSDISNITSSFRNVADAIADIRKAIGTLDDGSEMKSLLSSINDITSSLGRASDETETLVKSLNQISKKDFSFNVGFDLGNNKKSSLAYGREARKSIMPQLEAQVKYLEDLLGGEALATGKMFTAGISLEDMDKALAGFNSKSMIEKMEAYEKYIGYLKKAASSLDVDLSGFNSQFEKSASQMIDEVTGVKQATDIAEDAMQKFKGFIGSGIDDASLKQILDDLNEIKIALQSLTSNNALDGLTQSFNTLSQTLDKLITNANNIKTVLGNSFDGATNGAKEAAQAVEQVSQAVDGIKVSSKFDGFKSIASEIKGDLSNLKESLDMMGFDGSSVKQITKEFKQLGISVQSVSSTINRDGSFQLNVKGLNEAKQEITAIGKIAKDETNLDFKVTVTDNTLKDLKNDMANFEKMQDKISDIKVKIKGLEAIDEKSKQVKELKRQLEDLEDTYAVSMGSFMDKAYANGDILSSGDIAKFQADIAAATEKAENELRELDAKIADTKRKLSNGIELKSLDGGAYWKQVDNLNKRFHNLSNVTDSSKMSIDRLNQALKDMKSASTDDNRIKAEKMYKAVLQETEAQIRKNEQAEKDKINRDKLVQDRNNLSLTMDNWLKNNSKAANQFGDRVKKLQDELRSCDSVRLDGIKKEFTEIRLEAEKAGKTSKTFGDKLKDQFAKYSAYFGIAEMFMYTEQGLRDMFEQVKLIDSAMTELKKVTDETDATYKQFLGNAAERAKKIGTTIDGLVDSTAEFAKIGYSFEDSQELAEVANVYKLVGDNIESAEVATQSLISTMAAFKHEMNGLSNADFAMSIVDKFNEVSNKYSIGSGGLGEALTRSASSMAAANNTLDETIALITAARLSWLFI